MRNLRAAVAYVPGVLLVTCVAAMIVSASPRLRGLAWLPVGWAAVVGLLGEPHRLPRWSRDLLPLARPRPYGPGAVGSHSQAGRIIDVLVTEA